MLSSNWPYPGKASQEYLKFFITADAKDAELIIGKRF